MSAKSIYFESKKSEDDDISSSSSIPWNSDAIKQNKVLWEYVERMLGAEDALPDDEPELRQEILDWQAKFPKLVENKLNFKTRHSTFNTNISETHDSSSSPDSASIDNDDDEEYLRWSATTKNQFLTKRRKSINRESKNQHFELADDFKELHIAPFTLRQRKSAHVFGQRNLSTASSISESLVPVKTERYKITLKSGLHTQRANANSTPPTGSRFHMPPILNVIDSKRRFCGNSSFVQLTHIHQAKSAAVHSTSRQPSQLRVWNKPLVSVANNRFLNNRNAIVLPALRHQITSPIYPSNQSSAGRGNAASQQFASFSTSHPSSSSSGGIRGRHRVQYVSNSQMTINSTPGGRSVSAEHAPMHESFYHL